ncbi:MAG: 50S ribosomal protein L23 [Ferrimicrobium sp.]
MSRFDYYGVLRRPVVSEKSYGLMEDKVYTFEVEPTATKIEVQKAVEELFSVKVRKVNTLIRKGKTRRNRRTGSRVRLSDRKIAYVTLRDGFSIELMAK